MPLEGMLAGKFRQIIGIGLRRFQHRLFSVRARWRQKPSALSKL